MTDADIVWARMRAVYAGFLDGDPAAVDMLLAQDVTIWDSDEFAMTRGLSALGDLRARRPATGPATVTVADLEAVDPVVDVWGDTALLRHVLRVYRSDGSEQVVRNTSVWRRIRGEWVAVHNHEDLAGGGEYPLGRATST